ncbi:unnamed protein product, partial [Ectocarpus sp. 13 AM-2016]
MGVVRDPEHGNTWVCDYRYNFLNRHSFRAGKMADVPKTSDLMSDLLQEFADDMAKQGLDHNLRPGMVRATGSSKSRKKTKAGARFPLVEDIFDEPDGGLDDGRRTIIQPDEMSFSSDDDSDDDGGLVLTTKGSATGGVTKKAAKGGAEAGRLPRGAAAG